MRLTSVIVVPVPRRNPKPPKPRGRRSAELEATDALKAANRLQSCRSKRRFATEREADDALYQARMEGRLLGSYQCDICGGWHFTSRRSE